MNATKILLFLVYIILSVVPIQDQHVQMSLWLRNLLRTLKTDNNEYQLLLLFDQNPKSNTEEIIREICKIRPTLTISFQDATVERANQMSKVSSLENPRTTMIIIVHLSKEDPDFRELNKPIEFVSQISEPRRRSKCLLILPKRQEKFAYQNLLQKMWSKNFLDVTILELYEDKEESMMHRINPFKNSSSRKWYPAKKTSAKKPSSNKPIALFPSKTRNLNGYEMKVGIMNYPPSVFLQRDEGLLNLFGYDVSLTEAFSKAMNFKVTWIAPKEKNPWGIGYCTKENSTGLKYEIMHNRVQYLATESGRYGACDEKLYEWSTGSKMINMVIVVPILPNEENHLETNWSIIKAALLVGIFVSTWMVSRLLHFEQKNWRFLEIMRIAFATAVPREPQNLAERILFGSILVSCLMNSSAIYSAFTEMNMEQTSEIAMTSINDVVSSNLRPFITNSFYAEHEKTSDLSSQMLLKKSTQVEDLNEALTRLSTEKDVACVMRGDQAKWMIEKNKENRPTTKIVDEALKSSVTGMILERRSPFVERFDEVMLKLIQSGLVYKWQNTRFGGVLNVEETDEVSTFRNHWEVRIYKQLIYMLIFGNACAFVVFVCEILFGYLKSKRGG